MINPFKTPFAEATTQWLRPLKGTYRFTVVTLALVVLAMLANSLVRYDQLVVWQQEAHTTHLGDAPLFSTADAPFFVRQANLIRTHSSLPGFDLARSFPNRILSPSGQPAFSSVRSWPLLSYIIAHLSSDTDMESLLTTANTMIIITSAITALMIATCFGAAGYWIEGSVAALGGGLSGAYLVRSSIGRIDTDQMNLGFFYLLFGLVLLAGYAKSRTQTLFWSAVAGICANFFMWWYGKADLIVIAILALIWLHICRGENKITASASVAIFLLISQITHFNPLQSLYFKDVIISSNFLFPNTLHTITEIQRISLTQILQNSVGSVEMGVFCLTGLAVFFFRHPVIAVALGPLAAFALLNFAIGNRAIFYSTPILWFGMAFLMSTGLKLIVKTCNRGIVNEQQNYLATIISAAIALTIAWVNSPTNYVPQPSFPKPVLQGLMSLKSATETENSVVATWWDYGYASMLMNGLPTLHDGGTQTTPATHFVASAFLGTEQSTSVGTLKFIATKGNQGISIAETNDELQRNFHSSINLPSPNLYLVLTKQMTGWISSISQIANWDIETGTPVIPRGNNSGPQVFYEPLNCRLAGYPQQLNCAGLRFELEKGLVNGVPALAGWAHSQDGALLRRKDFNHDGDFALQIVQIGSQINVFFMHRQLFESTFNELYHLGQIDHPSISLHYDDYPYIRIYKMKGDPAD